MDTLSWWNEDLLLRNLICCAWIVDGNTLAFASLTSIIIALVDQGGIRPTFGCDELVCTACGFTKH